MPFSLHIPLPGPFSYSRRIGGRRRRGGGLGSAMYWLLIGWWLVPMWLMVKWSVIAVAWLCVFGYNLAQGNNRPPRLVGGRITNPPGRAA